jgi:hypothetical protein
MHIALGAWRKLANDSVLALGGLNTSFGFRFLTLHLCAHEFFF